ncbi:hypothetical protein GGF44_001536 [Coemansia sp. RSA 1694]|nr:hypothetical protein GGF44_001536 [Coemansia sp. RSA 1694]
MNPSTERPAPISREASLGPESPATEKPAPLSRVNSLLAKVRNSIDSIIPNPRDIPLDMESLASDKSHQVSVESLLSLDQPVTEEVDPVSSASPLGQEKLSIEKPAPLSRVNSLLSKLNMSMESINPLARKAPISNEKEEDTHPLASLSRRDSVSSKEGEVKERLVPLLDSYLIDNWDRKTGAIVTFKDGKEGFKLLPKGVAGLQDEEFLGVVKNMLPANMREKVKGVRRINNFVSRAPKRLCSYKM